MDPWKKKLPMQLTILRMILVLPILFCLMTSHAELHFIAALIFIFAGITDYYDGYFARKYNAVTSMGKFMDPIADKILVTSVLTLLIPVGKIDPYMVILISARDTFVGGIRAVAATDNLIIDAKPTGKWKAALQMGAIPALMIGDYISLPQFSVEKIAYFVLWICVALSLKSGLDYYLSYKASRKKLSQL